MKIGITTTPVYNIQNQPKNIDGIGTYTLNLCQSLMAQNVQIQEIYFKTLPEMFRKAQSTANSDFMLANNPLLSLLPSHSFHLADEVALLHVTDYLIPRVSSIPVIASIHDAIMLKPTAWQHGAKPLKTIKKYLLKKMARNADHYITCSYAMIEDLVQHWKIPRQKISVTHYGLATAWRDSLPKQRIAEVLNKYQITKPFLLTVGTLQPRKNFERIMAAYQSLPKDIHENFQLIIVGKNHASLTPPALLNKINALQKDGQVLWLKYISLQELRCLYQSALLLLYPSLEEGFGFPILEGFASTTPVITSHYGSMAEIADQAAILVDPYSTDEIRTAILKIINNLNLQNQLKILGLQRLENFTWEKCAKETLEIYKKFI